MRGGNESFILKAVHLLCSGRDEDAVRYYFDDFVFLLQDPPCRQGAEEKYDDDSGNGGL